MESEVCRGNVLPQPDMKLQAAGLFLTTSCFVVKEMQRSESSSVKRKELNPKISSGITYHRLKNSLELWSLAAHL